MLPRQATALVALACLFVAGLGESAAAENGNEALIPEVETLDPLGDVLDESAPLLTLSSPQIRSTSARYSVPAKTPCPPTSPEMIRQPTTTNPGYGTKDPQDPETSQTYPTTPDNQYGPSTEAADAQHYQTMTSELPEEEEEAESAAYQPQPDVPSAGEYWNRGERESGRFNDNNSRDRRRHHHHRRPARAQDNPTDLKTDIPKDTRYQPQPATRRHWNRGGRESGRFEDDNGRDDRRNHHRRPIRPDDNHNYAVTDIPEDTRYQPQPIAPATGGRWNHGGREAGRFEDSNGRDGRHHYRHQPARTEDNQHYHAPGRSDGPNRPGPVGDKQYVKPEYAHKRDPKPEDKKRVGPPRHDRPKPQLRSAGGPGDYSSQ